jgi:hypothetical protein
MANQPPPPTARPPPDVPADPRIDATLTDYLRRFALWTRTMFQAKEDSGVAHQQILLMESGVIGVPRVYALEVDASSGVPKLTLAQQALAGAKGGVEVTFAPTTGYGESIVTNPTGTASATYVMMGMNLALPAIIAATALWVTCDGQITNSANNGETDCVICYGTGTPPVNGAAQVGTIAGQPARYKATAANDFTPFSLTALIQGVVKGQIYWIDVAVKTVGGGTGRVMDLDLCTFGLA